MDLKLVGGWEEVGWNYLGVKLVVGFLDGWLIWKEWNENGLNLNGLYSCMIKFGLNWVVALIRLEGGSLMGGEKCKTKRYRFFYGV